MNEVRANRAEMEAFVRHCQVNRVEGTVTAISEDVYILSGGGVPQKLGPFEVPNEARDTFGQTETWLHSHGFKPDGIIGSR